MLNHIAVILRGHVRTWRWIYPYVFNFYDKLAYNVDYYFVSWQGSELNTNIAGSFEGKNLIAYQLIKPNTDINFSYLSAAYMSHLMLAYKHKREKSVKYDMVIDSRPDVLPFFRPNRHIFKPEPNILYTPHFELHFNYRTNYYDIAIADWFLASTSKVHDVMCERFIEPNDQSNQITVRTFAEDQGFYVNALPYVSPIMCRPTISEAVANNNVTIEFAYETSHRWASMSREDKVKLLEEKNIPFMDYETGSGTCSI